VFLADLSFGEKVMAKVEVYENINLREAAEVLSKAIKSRKNIYLIAKCDVEYYGRSSSKLEEGERQIIIKPDGAFLNIDL